MPGFGLRAAAALVAAVVGMTVTLPAAVAAGRVPVLAGPWSRDQEGYGHAKPRTIFNGGDPTGLVKKIHWTSWGGPQAIGSGTGFWVGPHQVVAQGHFEKGAKVVLFQLGRCHGKSAYDAIEWFFPSRGQRFSSGTYINACTGKYYLNGHLD
jgi:hypothetical protein